MLYLLCGTPDEELLNSEYLRDDVEFRVAGVHVQAAE